MGKSKLISMFMAVGMTISAVGGTIYGQVDKPRVFFKKQFRQHLNNNQAIRFGDKTLEKMICMNIGKTKGHISKAEAYQVTSLVLSPLYLVNNAKTNGNANIESLEGLQYFTNLKNLEISFLNINDIKAISKLKNLSELDLRGNDISDISPLEENTDLCKLSLSMNKINNVSALSHLTNLKDLDVSYNQINDVSWLKNLKNLQSVDLSYNAVSNVDCLKSCNLLKQLNAEHNPVYDKKSIKKWI